MAILSQDALHFTDVQNRGEIPVERCTLLSMPHHNQIQTVICEKRVIGDQVLVATIYPTGEIDEKTYQYNPTTGQHDKMIGRYHRFPNGAQRTCNVLPGQALDDAEKQAISRFHD